MAGASMGVIWLAIGSVELDAHSLGTGCTPNAEYGRSVFLLVCGRRCCYERS
jgi:hypothetical protein